MTGIDFNASPDKRRTTWVLSRFLQHSAELARLAVPVVFSRAGILTLSLVDTAMLGPYGAEEVGRYGLGSSVFVFLLVCGIGMLFGTVVETSQMRGDGKLSETGRIWRWSLPYAAILGVIGVGLTLMSGYYFLLVGQTPHLAEISARVTVLHGLSLLPLMIYFVSNMYLEAMGRPMPGMVLVWAANILNIPLNYWLIDGGMGVSGADGAALATTICRSLMMVAIIGYLWYLGGKKDYGIRQKTGVSWLKGGRAARRHGYAAGPAYAAESGAYHVMFIFAGWMTTAELASFSVNMNLLAMIFMYSLGVANATAVRVGVAQGRRDWPDRALAGWTGCFWVMALLLPVAGILLFAPQQTISFIYQIDDPVVLAVVAPATMLVGIAMVFDGGQFTLANALRASGDAWIPTLMNFVGFVCVMIPAGYIIGWVMQRHSEGLYEGILLASGLVFLILLSRWLWICQRKR